MAELAPWQLRLWEAPRLARNGAVVHVGSRKALALLAVLALDFSASRARLTTLLWPDGDAAGGRRNLRRELFRLRELGVPLLEDAEGTLALGAGIALDVTRGTVVEAPPAALLLDGLDGLAGVEFDAWLQRSRDRLTEHRNQALQAQAEDCERAGDPDAALSWFERASAADPLREPVVHHLMRLLAQRGDVGGALRVYRQFGDVLREELGVAPSQALRELAEGLRAASGAAAASPVPGAGAALPAVGSMRASGLPAKAPYVVRTAVHERVDAAWRRGQRVYLHGPAGTGKTRLAMELAAARGPWLHVACEPQDAGLPYASLVRVLRALRESAHDVALPEWVLRELSQLMPELGTSTPSPASDEARQRLLAAAAQAWQLMMADNFTAFVLDDWHWSDDASVELWARLDSMAPLAGGVAWIVAYRSAQLPPAALKRQRLEVDQGGGVAIALQGMDESEVLALTQGLSGAPGGTLFSQRLHGATEGNPFFLLETLRHLFEEGLLTADADGWSTPFDDDTTDYAELPVPPSVRAAVLARVRALGPTVQRLLETASLCPGEIDLRLLAGIPGSSDSSDSSGATASNEEHVVAALEHAQAARLIEPAGTSWRFAHDLVRQSLAQGLSAARRRLLHERLAARLQRLHAAPALIANHWELADRRQEAIPWRVAAAESAARVHAPAEALAHYAQALTDGARGAAAARLHHAMAQIHMLLLDHNAADQALAAALEAAATDAQGADDALRTQLSRVEHLRETDRVDESLALLDSLAQELVDAAPPLHAQAIGARASILLRTGRHDEGERLFQQAEALLTGRADARSQLGALLLEHARLCLRRGDLQRARALGQQAVVLHESIDQPSALAQALIVTGIVDLYSGQGSRAAVDLDRARALAQRCGHVPTQRAAILNLVKWHTDRGETGAAVALLHEGEALAPGFEHRRAELAFLEARYFVHFLRGEAEPARTAAARLLAFADGTGSRHTRVGTHALDPVERIGARMLIVDLFLLLGDSARARALLAEAQALCAPLQTAGERHHYAAAFALKKAWLALAEARLDEALAQLPPHPLPRLEDRFARAWIGAAAARRCGAMALAQHHLAAVVMTDAVSIDQLVPWLGESLALAHVGADASHAPLALALELKASGRVPALQAAALDLEIERHRSAG